MPSVQSEDLALLLFGKQSEFGESLMLHIPNGQWIIVDSFLYKDKKPIAQWYCEQKQIDMANEISHVVCTHWHDDHMHGISTVLEECENAQLVYTKHNTAFLTEIYKKLNDIDATRDVEDRKASELVTSIEIAKSRSFDHRETWKVAAPGRELVCQSEVNMGTKVECLSPSELSAEEYDNELVELVRNNGIVNGEIINEDSGNLTSIAIGVKSSLGQIFLGADLECNVALKHGTICSSTSEEVQRRNLMWKEKKESCENNCVENSKYGFCNLVEKVENFEEYKFNLVKYPHHGSITAYCPKFWKNSVSDDVIGGTVCCGRSMLPDPFCITQVSNLVNNFYISNISRYKKNFIRQEDDIGTLKLFKDAKIEIRKMSKKELGIILFKTNRPNNWDVYTYGAAGRIPNKEKIDILLSALSGLAKKQGLSNANTMGISDTEKNNSQEPNTEIIAT